MLNNLVSWMHLLGQMIPQNRDSKISKDQPLINHVLSLEITLICQISAEKCLEFKKYY